VVDEQGDFGEVALFPFVTGEIADDVAVNGGAVVEVAESVEAWRGVIGVYECLLRR